MRTRSKVAVDSYTKVTDSYTCPTVNLPDVLYCIICVLNVNMANNLFCSVWLSRHHSITPLRHAFNSITFHSITHSTPSRSTPSRSCVSGVECDGVVNFCNIKFLQTNWYLAGINAHIFERLSSSRIDCIHIYGRVYQFHTVSLWSEWRCYKHTHQSQQTNFEKCLLKQTFAVSII